MPKIAIAGFVDEKTVPMSRRGGPGNPELAEITDALITAADEGNKGFAFIPIEDKVERRRTGESIRNQLRARGYNCEKVSGTGQGTVKVSIPGKPGKHKKVTKTLEGLYLRASAVDVGRRGEDPAPIKKKKKAVA